MVCFKKHTRGFSLIELLVTLTIATLVVGSVLVQFRAFDNVVVLKGLAYEVAYALREAQVFAVSSGIDDGSENFDRPYGVFFDLDKQREYTLFIDNNDSGKFDAGDIVVETYEIKDSFRIGQICLKVPADDCVVFDGAVSNEREVSIVYQRPEFDANFYVIDNGLDYAAMGNIVEVVVRIESSRQPANYFDVTAGITGQISVSANGG